MNTDFWRQTGALLSDAMRLIRAGGTRLLWFILLSQLIILAMALPLLQWVFRNALRSLGMTGLDFGAFDFGRVSGFAPALLIGIALLAFWAVSLQFSALLLLLDRRRRTAEFITAEFITDENSADKSITENFTENNSVKHAAADLMRVWRKLLLPSSLPLIGYLFFFIPLSGFGFGSVLQQNISLPLFITDELNKSTVGAVILAVVSTLIAFANLRLALTMPVFTLTQANGRQSTRVSRRLTRRSAGAQLALAVAAVMVIAAVLMVILIFVSIAPTALSDRLWPAASHVIAALSLGAAQIAGAMLSGLVVAGIAGVLISFLHRHRDEVTHAWYHGPSTQTPRRHRTADGPGALAAVPAAVPAVLPAAALASVLIAGVIALGLGNVKLIERLDGGSRTLVLSHRGFAPGGVENTISGLEAAADLRVDLVEIDVMQAKDGGFVVMHDVELSRLTGKPLKVRDLTVTELTEFTVRNHLGREDRIPVLAEYVVRAGELEMPLLIEIKMSGAETADHVDRLVAELDALGGLDEHMYHSLDAPSVARLKELHPGLYVGYTMAFAADQVPATPADFIVVEQWTASEKMQRSADEAGLGFMVWTVNDEAGIREYLRRGADAIVSDRPDLVLAEQTRIAEQQGLAATLTDALQRFVVFI